MEKSLGETPKKKHLLELSASEKRALVEALHTDYSVREIADTLGFNRGLLYYQSKLKLRTSTYDTCTTQDSADFHDFLQRGNLMTSQWKTEKNKFIQKKNAITIAQAVKKHLDVLEDDPQSQKRWVWELLQNAHDASIASSKGLIAEIRDNSKELVFSHNGSRFTMDHIYHLIFHGSTKIEDEEAIGRFGSGFLATHILSWHIDISGRFEDDEDGEWFNFRLTRRPESEETLAGLMTDAWDNFKPVSSLQIPLPQDFTTRFKYPITENRAKCAVEQGIRILTQCASFVVVFNKVFRRIDIQEPRELQSFEVQRRSSDVSKLCEINVIHRINENQTGLKYLLVEGQKASVAVQLQLVDAHPECLSVGETPRLFADFPLIGTESFSFPVVINGNREIFKPNENRDGVRLGKGSPSDSDTNRNNQAVIKEACDLLVILIKYAASKGWNHLHRWTKIPSTEKLVDIEQSWLKEQIKLELIEKIRETPVVLTLSGEPIETKAAVIPITESCENVERLWDLLKDRKEYREKSPRRGESKGWCNAFKSWAKVHEKDFSEAFPEVINARSLADNLEDFACLRDLQKLLQEDVSAIEWLDQLYGFLKNNELFDDKIRDLYIFPNQDGEFCQLDDLHPDKNIDKELKDIDKLLEGEIHKKLRSDVLHSLEDESGDGDWDNKQVVGELISQLQKLRPKMNPDDNFKNATIRLFAWIVRQDRKEYWEYLQEIPVFTDDGESHHSLRNASPNSIPPFAPVSAWQKDLQEFSDIFPQRRILPSEYFEVLPDSDDWRKLNEENIIRIGKDEDIITYEDAKKVNFKDFCPRGDDKLNQQEDGEHKTVNCIVVTNVIELTDLMAPLRDKPEYAVKFWRFLTQWLIKKDTQGFKEETLECESCTNVHGEVVTHKCYTAAWLKPVRDNQWIRRVSPSPKSLANLLRENKLAIRELSQNPDIDRLLDAIGVPRSDVDLALMAEDPVKRDAAVNFASEVYSMPEDRFVLAHQVVQRIKTADKSVLKDFEENEAKRRTIDENREVGKQVEESVKQILKEEFPEKKFNVKPVREGADLEIVELEVTQGDKTLWIEVKSTQNESDSQEVKMSSLQAQKAREEKENFLLCVVPIHDSTKTDTKTVREHMRFIANIGDKVASLCEDLDELEEFREDITADTPSGVRLDVEKTKAGILVKKSVWEKGGFRLEELAEHLKRTNNTFVT